jgi:signal peptide peptidase-like protein 2B
MSARRCARGAPGARLACVVTVFAALIGGAAASPDCYAASVRAALSLRQPARRRGLLLSRASCAAPPATPARPRRRRRLTAAAARRPPPAAASLPQVEVSAASARNATLAVVLYGYPAALGAPLSSAPGAPLALREAEPAHACGRVAPADPPGAAALVRRGGPDGGCTFEEKAAAVERAGYGAMLLYNNATGAAGDVCVFMAGGAADAPPDPPLALAAASLTAEAGTRLRTLVAAGRATVALRAPPQPALDPSAAVLWLLAVAAAGGGALWAGADVLAARASAGSGSGHGSGGGIDGEPAAAITARGAVLYLVVASGVLLLLFFLASHWLSTALAALFALGAWQAAAVALLAALRAAAPREWRAAALSLPFFGAVGALSAAASALAALAAATWLACRAAPWAWALQDALSVALLLLLLRAAHLPNLRVATALLGAAAAYDVWWVFLQPLVTGGASVMVAVASGGPAGAPPPMLLAVPFLRGLGSRPAFALLGLGDVALPGLLVALARRWDALGRAAAPPLRLFSFDPALSSSASDDDTGADEETPAATPTPPRRRAAPRRAAHAALYGGYFLPVLAAYGAGLALTFVALANSWFGDQGQPALLYLAPCTLGAAVGLAALRGELGALWRWDGGGGGGEREARLLLPESP